MPGPKEDKSGDPSPQIRNVIKAMPTPLCDALRALFLALDRYGVRPPVILVNRADWNIINAALKQEARTLDIPLVQDVTQHQLKFMDIRIVHRFDNTQ